MNLNKIVNYFFELGQLDKREHQGWQLFGIKEPNRISGHILRASQIGYILSCLEGDANPEKVAAMIIFHDNGKTRIGDQDKVAARYSFKREAEESVFLDQIEGIEKDIEKKLLEYYQEIDERDTKEGVVAEDANWLEQAFQAKEYYDLGYREAYDWIENVEKALETESAKMIIKEMKKVRFTEWWRGLMVMTYNKLK
jgi:putative hydrolases of HD superfamily